MACRDGQGGALASYAQGQPGGIVIENFRMLRDTEGKYTQYTATTEQSKTIGDLPMDTTTSPRSEA